MRDKYIVTPEGSLCYRIKKGSDKTVLFLHGGGGSISAWSLTDRYFNKTSFTKIYLDLRGHGKSFRPSSWQDYCLEKHSMDILTIINLLKIQKITLVGHCLGSMVAATFVSLHPDRVEKVILINPGINCNTLFFNSLTRCIVLFIYKIINLVGIKISSINKTRVNYFKYKGSHDFSPYRLWADFSHMGLKAALSHLVGFFHWNPIETYKKIDSPILIIGGKNDTIYGPKITNKIHQLIKKSIFELINSNHISIINNPKEVSSKILEFI